MPPQLGKLLVIIGLGIVVLGAIIWLGGGSLFSWFGRLPGDIRIERPNFRFYAPIVSMLLLSLVLSAIMWLVRRL
ncbi:DUF2905 domain-containing protein [Solirubrum puertoriconensis]|uniref:DUF2905 domain-containing protein n=1 Tax=Solirubrum puertoriconensis TaxID=1751427 RepID=A0A9X0HJS1_SOLP1|nr:DUF2905 domain-containing protein [Solirubrum puertoriconensis]KUG07200.1 hypothetical protein ASU33_12565 [Solirubrum puertoriconensis]